MLVLLALSCRPKLVIDDSPAAPDSAETAVDSVPCTLSTWYSDADGDGHGDPATAADACEASADQVTGNDDCDDTRASVYPGASEYCNNLDDDCDGAVDEDAVDASSWYSDADGDRLVLGVLRRGQPGGRRHRGLPTTSRSNRAAPSPRRSASRSWGAVRGSAMA